MHPRMSSRGWMEEVWLMRAPQRVWGGLAPERSDCRSWPASSVPATPWLRSISTPRAPSSRGRQALSRLPQQVQQAQVRDQDLGADLHPGGAESALGRKILGRFGAGVGAETAGFSLSDTSIFLLSHCFLAVGRRHGPRSRRRVFEVRPRQYAPGVWPVVWNQSSLRG